MEFQRSKVELIMGPMFSGKTTEARRRANRYRFVDGATILLFKPQADTRHEGTVVKTHSNEAIDFAHASTTIYDGQEFINYVKRWQTFQSLDVQQSSSPGQQTNDPTVHTSAAASKGPLVMLIDEAQFVKDLALAVTWVLTQERLVLIMAGLSGNFFREMFPDIAAVIPLVTELTKLTAVCMDCKVADAHYSRLKIPVPTEASQWKEIGGSDKYAACCQSCWRPPPSHHGSGKRHQTHEQDEDYTDMPPLVPDDDDDEESKAPARPPVVELLNGHI